MNIVSYVALAVIGVALFIIWVMKGKNVQFANVLNYIWQFLAFIVVAYYALVYIFSRRRSTIVLSLLLLGWTASVVLFIVFRLI